MTAPAVRPMTDDDLHRLVSGTHHDPHGVLGPHPHDGGVTVRTLRPWATTVRVAVGDERFDLQHEEYGVWVGVLPRPEVPDYRLEVEYDGPSRVDDPYRFLPTLGEIDLHLIGEGRHEELWKVLGAHTHTYDGIAGPVHGTSFAVWAPSAQGVRLARRLQLLGRPGAPDAGDGVHRGLGAVRARHRRRRPLQVRGARARRRLAAEGGPRRVPRRGPPGHRLGGVHLDVRVERPGIGASGGSRSGTTSR